MYRRLSFLFRLKLAAFALLVGVYPLTSQATSITSSFGTTSGANDDDQAGPIHGMIYKILTTGTYTNPTVNQGYAATHALSATDASAIEVQFKSLTWQTSSSGAFSTPGPHYVSIFSGLTVDSGGAVTSLGSFIGSSTTSISTATKNATVTWIFDNPVLTVGSSYQFVFSSVANPTLTSQIGGTSLELLKTTAPDTLLTETELLAGSSTGFNKRAIWEPVFSMVYDSVPVNHVPEPSTLLLVSLVGLASVAQGRKQPA
jgi:hypothetical protein